MNAEIPPSVQAPLPPAERAWPGRLVTLATVIVVVAVAAATFVLSYSGVHAVALQSGVSASLARYYPGVFDAVLVIACAAAPLRDARLWTRVYTWLVIFIVVGLLAAMDAVDAMGVVLPRRQTAGTVAVLPWVLMLLAFTLWLVVVRHFRVQQSRRFAQVPLGAPESLTAPESQVSPGLLAARQAPALPPGPSEPPAPEEPTAPEEPPAPEEPTAQEDGPEQAPGGDYWENSGPAPVVDELPESTPHDPPEDDQGPADPGSGPGPEGGDQPEESDGIPEVGGVPYATGPRLRRVRSLPVPPADDE
ncbi:MAG TPA: DUF2637 domain-containing protein [Trebonia sp.]|nr:DUF2637 domain-containing protein [Trebonia sp.]